MLDSKAPNCCGTPAERHKEESGQSYFSLESQQVESPALTQRSLIIDFLFIDISRCKRCQETRNALDASLLELSKVLDDIGASVTVRKVHVRTDEEARRLRLVSSPTIRLNGRDIQPEVKENLCESCCEIAGEDVNCRVWRFRGQDFTTPPKALLIDAILRELYAGPVQTAEKSSFKKDVPENLKNFFAATRGKQTPKWDRRRS